jgi:hypothetical protein
MADLRGCWCWRRQSAGASAADVRVGAGVASVRVLVQLVRALVLVLHVCWCRWRACWRWCKGCTCAGVGAVGMHAGVRAADSAAVAGA